MRSLHLVQSIHAGLRSSAVEEQAFTLLDSMAFESCSHHEDARCNLPEIHRSVAGYDVSHCSDIYRPGANALGPTQALMYAPETR